MIAFWLIASVLLLLASAFYSGNEMGLYCVNRLRLRLRAEHAHDIRARVLLDLTQRRQETVLSILLGNNLVAYLLTVCSARLITDALGVPGNRSEFYVAAILSPLVFVFGDVVPKNWFQVDANRLMMRSALLLHGTVYAFRLTGIVWVLQQLTRLIVQLAGQEAQSTLDSPRGEVMGLLREGGIRGALTIEQTRIVERVMNLSSVRVGTIMVPRRQVTTIPLDADLILFTEVVRKHHYSRLPVTGRDRKSIVGVVNVNDVLADGKDHPIEPCMQSPITLSASESAASALVQLQRAGQTLAIVTDPRHGYVGIVTLKDVVEEIFGELPAW